MHNIIFRIIKYLKFLRLLGIRLFIRVFFLPRGTVSLVPIASHDVWIRSRTPDLQVAMNSLNGEYEMLKYTLPRNFSGCIVDAGAYIGTSAIALRELFPNATIVCIEPSEENMAVLRMNCHELEGIEILNSALVASNVNQANLMDRGTGEWGYTVVGNPLDNPSVKKKSSIRLVNIAAVDKDFGKIGLLKLDIEGSEREIFLKDGHELEKIPVIFVELHDRIVEGCTSALFSLPGERVVVKGEGEKLLSLSLRPPG